MAGFVPRGKMSKKAQKELNRQRRVTWEFSPVTKTVESKKLYNRKKNTRNRYDDSGSGVFIIMTDISICTMWIRKCSGAAKRARNQTAAP